MSQRTKLRYPSTQHWVIYGLLFLLLLALTTTSGYEGDIAFWKQWATFTRQHGLGNAYLDPSNNYPPLFHYFLFALGKLTGSVEKLQYYIYSIKLFILPFDVAGALLAAWVFTPGGRNQRFTASLLLLANVAFVYNTVLWAQVDALYSFFVFGAVVLALRERAVGSVLCFVLAFNAKTQAVLFLPPLLLLWAPLGWRAPRIILSALGAAALLQLAILAPFIWGGERNTLPEIVRVVTHSVDFYPYTSMNAHNWWLFWTKSGITPDTLQFLGLTYKQWGLLGFMVASTVLLLPLALLAWRKMQQRLVFGASDYAMLLLSLGLLPVAFTYFNTQMHERYWHAAFLFLAGYGFLRKRYFLYGLFSLAYFLNLEAEMHALGLKKYGTFIFSGIFGGALFSLVLIVGVVELYKLVRAAPRGTFWRTAAAEPTPVRVLVP